MERRSRFGRWYRKSLLPPSQARKAQFCVYFPGSALWRGTSGCSINIASGPKRHMTPKWTFQRRRLRHFTISHTLRRLYSGTDPLLAHRCTPPKASSRPSGSGKCSPSGKELRIRAFTQPPQSGNRCTSGLEPVRHTCPSRLHASARLMHECLPRLPAWWNGQTLGWLEKKTDSLLSVLFRLLLRGIVDSRLHHDREDAKAR